MTSQERPQHVTPKFMNALFSESIEAGKVAPNTRMLLRLSARKESMSDNTYLQEMLNSYLGMPQCKGSALLPSPHFSARISDCDRTSEIPIQEMKGYQI